MNVYTIISMTYIQLIQPLSKQSGAAELIGIITASTMTDRLKYVVRLRSPIGGNYVTVYTHLNLILQPTIHLNAAHVELFRGHAHHTFKLITIFN